MQDLILQFQSYVASAGSWGPVIYMLLMIVAIIISPIPSSPLVIFAGIIFGWKLAFVWTIIGSTLGAIIAFYLARIFGTPLVKKLVSEKNLKKVENIFPEKKLAWTIFLLRIPPLPFFDAVSYAAGLTKISTKNFILATFFGLMPVVFLLSYFGEKAVSIGYFSLIVIAISLSLPFFIKIFIDYRKNKNLKIL